MVHPLPMCDVRTRVEPGRETPELWGNSPHLFVREPISLVMYVYQNV